MKRAVPFLAILSVIVLSSCSQRLRYPVTAKTDQVDTYFGTKVPDPYRWLENDTSASVAKWVQEQNSVTFGYLETIPFRTNVKNRLTKIWNYPKYSTPFRAGKNYFFYKNNGLQNQSVLYIQSSLDVPPEVFLDPNTFSADGTVALSGLAFSRDGNYCAYSISRSGSDWQEIYVMDVLSKKKLEDQLKWVKFSGTSFRGKGFYYNRYDAPSDTSKALTAKNEFQKVYFHTIGTSQKDDALIFEDKQHPQRLFGVGTTEDERFITLSVSEGGAKGNALYYRDTKRGGERFLPIVETFDDRIGVVDNIGGELLMFTNNNAPNNKVVLFTPGEKKWKEVLPEKSELLQNAGTVGRKLIATYLKDVSHRVYVYDFAGKLENEIELPTLGTANGFGGEREDTFTFYSFTSFTYPPTFYRYDLKTKQSSLFRKTEVDFKGDNFETKQVFFKSKDGTRIPMFLVHKKGLKLDGTNPTLLYGYGGFNISSLPGFSISRLVWLEQGGIYALANIRGGGEYGEQWHEAGTGLKKQNVFDDFIAAAEYLVASKYTSPKMLAIQGGSNGGLLVGAVMNRRPDLFKVALPAVGVMDMLRFHKFTIGWAWVRDYGSSDDSVHFKNLLLFSPLHNIKAAPYPATLVTTADHDDRVVPAHSFKYVATLQEHQRGDNPVLIRIETKAGHGGGKPTTKIIEETADLYSFVFYNMGISPKF